MQRQTPQRIAIESEFASAGRPLGPQEILDAARRHVPSLNLATVYRTLNRMVEDRTIRPVQLPGAPPRYELRLVADRHHHHFRCEKCDSLFDLQGCVQGLKKLLPRGFLMKRHDIILYGLCRSCADGR